MMESYYIIRITRSEKSFFNGERYVGSTPNSYYSFAFLDKAATFPTEADAENCLIKHKEDLFNSAALTNLYIESIEIVHVVRKENVVNDFSNLDELTEWYKQ